MQVLIQKSLGWSLRFCCSNQLQAESYASLKHKLGNSVEHLFSKPYAWNPGFSHDPRKCDLRPLIDYGLVEQAGVNPITHWLINTWKLSPVPQREEEQLCETALAWEGTDLNTGSGQLDEKVTVELRSKRWAGLKGEDGEKKVFQTEGAACAKILWAARTRSMSLGS